jgi:hypothetical protein
MTELGLNCVPQLPHPLLRLAKRTAFENFSNRSIVPASSPNAVVMRNRATLDFNADHSHARDNHNEVDLAELACPGAGEAERVKHGPFRAFGRRFQCLENTPL